MCVLLPLACAALLTDSLMHGAQDQDMPSEQVPSIFNGAQAWTEMLSGDVGRGWCTLLVRDGRSGTSMPSPGDRERALALLSNLILKRAEASGVQQLAVMQSSITRTCGIWTNVDNLKLLMAILQCRTLQKLTGWARANDGTEAAATCALDQNTLCASCTSMLVERSGHSQKQKYLTPMHEWLASQQWNF